MPSNIPINTPSYMPSNTPSDTPSDMPSDIPSNTSCDSPSDMPCETPTDTNCDCLVWIVFYIACPESVQCFCIPSVQQYKITLFIGWHPNTTPPLHRRHPYPDNMLCEINSCQRENHTKILFHYTIHHKVGQGNRCEENRTARWRDPNPVIVHFYLYLLI